MGFDFSADRLPSKEDIEKNKLKPCLNDMCCNYNTTMEYNCLTFNRCDRANTCKVYITEEPVSIWRKRWKRLKGLLGGSNNDNKSRHFFTRQVYKIMDAIEKELKEDEKDK